MENSNATLVTEETAFNDLFTYIQQRVTLTDSDKAFIRQRFTLRQLKRKSYFLREGDIGFEQAFIISGTMRVFYIDGKAQEHVLDLKIGGLEIWRVLNCVHLPNLTCRP
jgi:hypothetical protein